MSRHRQSTALLIFAAILAVRSTSAGDEWDDFHITIDPSSPTDEDSFDLRAFRWFPDSGYLRIDQSISVSGYQIDMWALIQDQHTRPGSAFLTVMTPGGAFFNDFGPLASGTYQVNAALWMTPWPSTSGGYLYDQGGLQFTVTRAGTNAEFPGNFNGDNVVDAGDYVAWRKIDGGSGGYHAWEANFGATDGGVSAATGAVPEPTPALLLAVAGGFLTRRTFRRASKLVGGRHVENPPVTRPADGPRHPSCCPPVGVPKLIDAPVSDTYT